MTKTVIGFAIICFMLLGVSISAQADGNTVQLENTHVFTIKSDRNDTPIKIFVITPDGYQPDIAHPVIYTFDADLHLGLMSTLTEQTTRTIRRLGITPPLVIAIGYGNGELALEKRITDLTPNADHFDIHKRPNSKPWPKFGGGDTFLELLTQEVKPFIESRYKIDTTMETLYGHSFGGLLTLHALTTITDQFDRYAAASPSLWFNQSKTMKDVIAFNAQKRENVTAKIPLLMTIGGDEEDLKGWSLRNHPKPELRQTWLKKNRMLSNAMDLAKNLEKHDGKIAITFLIYGGLEHMPANPAAFYEVLRFASEKRPLQ